jgi:hypothetical protein
MIYIVRSPFSCGNPFSGAFLPRPAISTFLLRNAIHSLLCQQYQLQSFPIQRNIVFTPRPDPLFLAFARAVFLNSQNSVAPRPQSRSFLEERPMPFSSLPAVPFHSNVGIPSNRGTTYADRVQRFNHAKHAVAIQNNVDGEGYFKSVINEHLNSLNQEDKAKFRQKVEESDPEVFVELPRMAVKKAIAMPQPLTQANTPKFMHAHLTELEELRKKHQALRQNSANFQEKMKAIENRIGAIGTAFSRETDCIASMQRALETVS